MDFVSCRYQTFVRISIESEDFSDYTGLHFHNTVFSNSSKFSVVILWVQIVVDEYLPSVSDHKKCIYALGDCAYVENGPLPYTAQVCI